MLDLDKVTFKGLHLGSGLAYGLYHLFRRGLSKSYRREENKY